MVLANGPLWFKNVLENFHSDNLFSADLLSRSGLALGFVGNDHHGARGYAQWTYKAELAACSSLRAFALILTISSTSLSLGGGSSESPVMSASEACSSS